MTGSIVDAARSESILPIDRAPGSELRSQSLDDVTITSEPQQGATYDDLVSFATRVEELGFGGWFRSDHYLAMDVEGLPGPTDAWITLAGLAR